jgi:hypothetical protein
MDDTINRIIQAAAALDPEEQPWFIAREAIKAARAADAAISDQALESELKAWWKGAVHPLSSPAFHTISTHIAWGRHLLSGGRP